MPNRKIRPCMVKHLANVPESPSPKRRLEYCVARQLCHDAADTRAEALNICKPPKPPKRDTAERRYNRCVAHVEEKMFYNEGKKVNQYAICHASVG